MLVFSEYIHRLRSDSFEKIIPFINKPNVEIGLEVGAGDGYQSKLLIKYLKKLVVTDLDDKRLIFEKYDNIEYKICDAEKVTEIFRAQSFDLIYSSHLLEHLPDLDRFLYDSKSLVKNGGISIHIVPSSWYAFFRLFFWYVSLGIRTIKKLRSGKNIDLKSKAHDPRSNNIKKEVQPRIRILELLLPRPHGISDSLMQEVKVLSLRSWKNKFEQNGYSIIKMIRGDVYSGYGFGFETARRMLFRLGISSEFIFIMKNQDD